MPHLVCIIQEPQRSLHVLEVAWVSDSFSDRGVGGVWGEAVIYRGGIEEGGGEVGEEVREEWVALGFGLSGVAPGASVDEAVRS